MIVNAYSLSKPATKWALYRLMKPFVRCFILNTYLQSIRVLLWGKVVSIKFRGHSLAPVRINTCLLKEEGSTSRLVELTK